MVFINKTAETPVSPFLYRMCNELIVYTPIKQKPAFSEEQEITTSYSTFYFEDLVFTERIFDLK
jgi:hypothetical protein